MSGPRIAGWRLAATIGLWLVLGAVLIGGTLLAIRLGFESLVAAHRAAIGALLIVEAYVSLLVSLLVAFGGWRGVRERLGLRFTRTRDIGLALLAWIGALVLGGVATGLLTPVLGPPQSNATALLGRSFDPLFVVLIVPTVCVLAPFCEELLFRGAIFGWLRWRTAVPVAAVISAAVFAAAHLLPPLFPALFVFGLAAAVVYQATGSTLNSFVMHAAQNTSAVLITYAVLTHRLAA
jgi:membrane protease YdiL (CAAX protease family)